ncbi:MAG: hypothetical protein HONBIEJF_00982 [Fimbriimonadaceae bacterium]|nr:hypothetical protein [Fimbriimonadaceae bacterium]
MLVLVIECFRSGNPKAVGERFQEKGRMLPEGVTYQASWFDSDGKRCYQIMRTPSLEALEPWLSAWADLVDFDVRPIVPSEEFWKLAGDLGQTELGVTMSE